MTKHQDGTLEGFQSAWGEPRSSPKANGYLPAGPTTYPVCPLCTCPLGEGAIATLALGGLAGGQRRTPSTAQLNTSGDSKLLERSAVEMEDGRY